MQGRDVAEIPESVEDSDVVQFFTPLNMSRMTVNIQESSMETENVKPFHTPLPTYQI